MFNPLMIDVAIRNQSEQQSYAERERKSMAVRKARYGLDRRLFVQLGDVLIAAGEKLHRRYGVALNGETNLYQTRLMGR